MIARLSLSLLAAVSLAAVSLAACGGGDEAAEEADAEAPAEAAETPAAPSTPAYAGPVPEVGYDWTVRTETLERGRAMTLAYELPDTDDQPLAFTCEEGGQRVFAQLDSATPGVGAIILRSGEAQAMYPVSERQASELSGGEFLTVPIDVGDAVLDAFETGGWVNLSVAGVARDLAAHPGAGRDAIGDFLAFCAAAPEAPATASPSSAEAAPG